MAWTSGGFPSSPKVRKASRPLSMISENPDDAIDPGRGHTTTNSNVQGQDDTNRSRSRSSPQISRAMPTRRKAVAPLQHPVKVLLDNQTDSKISSIKSSMPDNAVQRKTKFHMPEQTTTVSSIIKMFSSSPNNNLNQTDNVNKNCCSKSPLPDNINETDADSRTTSKPINSDSDSGILSDILNSSDIIDRNHNNLTCKSVYTCKENNSINQNKTISPNKSIDTQSNAIPHSKCNGSDIKTPFISDQNGTMIEACNDNHTQGSESNKSPHNNASSTDRINVCNHFQNHESCDGNVYNKSNNNSNIDNSSCVNGVGNNHISDYGVPYHSKTSENNHTTINHDEEDDSSFNTSNKTSDNLHSMETGDVFLTSTPNPKPLEKNKPSFHHHYSNTQPNEPSFQTQHHNSQQNHVFATQQDKHISTASIKFQQQQSDNSGASHSQSKHSHKHILLHNKSDSAIILDKSNNNANPDTSTALDGETLEWKRRVKRSVSLIKSPSMSELGGPKRRISSIHLSNSDSDISDNGQHLSSYHNYNTHLSTNENKNNGIIIDQSNQQPIRRISAIDQSDFSLLKVATTRLNLPTRRASVTAWKEKYLTRFGPFKSWPFAKSKEKDISKDDNTIDNQPKSLEDLLNAKDKWEITEDVKNRINGSLTWLRQELINLRLQDQSLARQFLNLRHAMNAFRLAVECEGHQELIDDAQEDMEEIRELSQLVDIPPEMLSPLSPLKHVGITRMNISSRRFSTC